MHYKPWSKDKLPQGQDQIEELVELIQKDGAQYLRNVHLTRTNDDTSDKLLVMSGQDNGRAGTLIALINAVTILNETKHQEKEQELSVFSIVRRLREQRLEMVDSIEQYQFIHDVLKKYNSLSSFETLAYAGWKFGLAEKFNLHEELDADQTMFSCLKDPKMMTEFVESSEKIIDNEIGQHDVVVGVGTGGCMLGPLIAQKTQVPFLPLQDSAGGLSAYADDLADKRVLIVDMSLNFKNAKHMQDVVAGLEEYCGSVAGMFTPQMKMELKDANMGANVACIVQA